MKEREKKKKRKRKKEEKRGITTETSNARRKLKVRKCSAHRCSPYPTVGKSTGTERELWGIKGECCGWFVEGRAM